MPVADRLVEVARAHGWSVVDNRAAGIVWFERGVEYAHLGTDTGRDRVLSAYGGISGRQAGAWYAGRSHSVGGRQVDRAGELAAHLRAEPHPRGSL